MRPKSALVLSSDIVEKASQRNGGMSWLSSVATTFAEYGFLLIYQFFAF